MKGEPLAAGELRRAKDHLKGSLMLGLESTSSRMSHLARQAIYDDGDESLDAMLAAIEQVTEPDVVRLAHRVLANGTLGLTVLGGVNGLIDSRGAARTGMIPRYTNPEMGRIWTEQRRYEAWLQVELAAADAMAGAGLVPAEAVVDLQEQRPFRRRPHRGNREDHPARRHRLHHRGRRARRPLGALAALRPDLVGRRRHRPGAAAGAGDGRDPAAGRRAACRHRRPRRGAPPHADDRPHAWRARRADDLRPEAGAVARPARPRSRSPTARPRGGACRQDLGRGRHLRPPRSGGRSRRLPAARPRTGADLHPGDPARPPRRAADARWPSPARRSRRSPSRFAACRRPRSARWRSRSARARRAPRRCRTSATRSAASRSSAWPGCCAPTPGAAFENVALWHERDISHSSVERVILPDSFIALDHMLRRFTRIVDRHGRVSGADAREPRALARRGVLGAGAARAGQAWHRRASRPTSGCSATPCARSTSRRTSRRCCCRTPTWCRVLGAEGIERAFDLDEQLRNVDVIFARVFEPVPAGKS